MGLRDDGSYVFLNADMMTFSLDGSRKQRSPRIKAGNNTVKVEMIDEIIDEIASWVRETHDLLNRLSIPPYGAPEGAV